MADNLASLQTVKDQLIARLMEITALPKPTYNVDGKNVNWTEYATMLRDQIEGVNDLLMQEGIYEFRSSGYS